MIVWQQSQQYKTHIIAYTDRGIIRIKRISPRRYEVYIHAQFSGKYTTQAKAKIAAEKYLSRIDAG